MRSGMRGVAAVAVAALLGAGLAACGEGDGNAAGASAGSGQPEASGVSSGQQAVYLDQLMAFLKTTAQGARVQRAEYRTEKRYLNIDVETDLPADDPAMYQLSREAGDWVTDHPEVHVDSVLVFSAGRTDFADGPVPGDNPLQDAADASAAELLNRLKATPQGPFIVRLRAQVIFGDVDISIRINRKAHEPGDSSPAAEETDAIVAALEESVRQWAGEHPDRNVTSLFIMDIEASGLGVSAFE